MNKIHSQGRVPFSWENKAGESKISSPKQSAIDHDKINNMSQLEVAPKLPPPPRLQVENGKNKGGSFLDLQIPLPPCAFQPPPPQRSSSKRPQKKTDDPFMIAIKQCTKSSSEREKLVRSNSGFGMKETKNKSLFSCKKSCNVVDGSIIKVTQLPISKPERKLDMFET